LVAHSGLITVMERAVRKAAPRYSLAEFFTTFPFDPEGEALFRDGAKRIEME